MRRFRLPRKTAIALAVLATVLAVPRFAGPAGERAGTHAPHRGAALTAAARPGQTTVGSDSTLPAAGTVPAAGPVRAVTIAKITPTVPAGGPCSVPGIGDIGGLLGFCSLGSSGLIGDLNNICQPSLPDPEPANAGIDAMVAPPAAGKQPSTLYDEYGVAGDYWAATNLQCSDMTSLIGNNVAGMVFDAAKSIDRVTITIYQAAAGEGILSWLQRVTDRLISSLGHAIYFPYLAVVVILGAIWLAWQGLIRKRGTRTIEGTIWMVVAAAAAILLIGQPSTVTGLGKGVSDGMSQALNTAFAKLPSPGPSSCVPLRKGDPQSGPATYNYTSGGTVVDQNADELWTVLVCQPWLDGEFGTSVYGAQGAKATAVNTYGRSLLWAQAIATNEKSSAGIIAAKQAAYAGIASSIQKQNPGLYPLFQGKEWTTRLEVGFAALFAAVVAGILVLLMSVTLILLKLGFLLLLIAGPLFLLVGTHPGFGRVLALRWAELLIGVLLKQAAVAVVLSVLLYCYALIMGTTNAVLPWALKILMIALVTIAAFIYRKPFQHLFAAVGYGVIGSHDQAAADLQRAGASARANSRTAATFAVPGFAAYRAGRWARRNPGQAAGLALAAVSAGGGAAAAGAAGVEAGLSPESAPSSEVTAAAAAAAGNGVTADGGAGRASVAARARAVAGQDGAGTGEAPPLNLRPRGRGPAGAAGTAGVATGPATPAPASTAPASTAPARTAPARTAPARTVSAGTGPAATGPAATGPVRVGPAGSAAAPASSGPARPAWPGNPARSASGPAGSAGLGSSGSPAPAPARPATPPRQAPPARQSGPPWGPGPGATAGGTAAPRQAAPGQAAPRQAGSGQAAPRQAAPGQVPPPVQSRRTWPLRQNAPARQPARPVRGTAPTPRAPEGEAREPSQWLGQPVNGPLTSQGTPPGQDNATEPDRAVPFWLRARRRG